MVGEILKKRREESGQDLREIAKTLKIRYDYLKAIEDENFEKLPVEVYIRGYIREYAKILNINPEAAIKAYTQQVSSPLPEKKRYSYQGDCKK
ncbi:MAG: helix-turn-helix domain-containing protein [Nitrospirota bacterium]